MDNFVFSIGFNGNNETVFLRFNVDIRGTLAANRFAVDAEVVGAGWRLVYAGDGLHELFFNLIKGFHA